MSDEFEGLKVFFPQYRKGKPGVQTFEGTILEHARKLGIEVRSECGGRGICGQCVVRIAEGEEALNPLTAAERQLALGPSERLACQAKIVKPANLRVFVKNVGSYSVLSETIEREIRPSLQLDGGDIELIDIVGNRVMVATRGACSACKSAPITLKNLVEAKLREFVTSDLVVEEVSK